MRYTFFLVILCCLSCNNKQDVPTELIGKWKTHHTRLNAKDISKSSDPTNENGLEFQSNGNYISFGNPRHQDQGVYEVDGANLLFKSKKITGVTKAKMTLVKDTLELKMSMDSTTTLFMKLYKMK